MPRALAIIRHLLFGQRSVGTPRCATKPPTVPAIDTLLKAARPHIAIAESLVVKQRLLVDALKRDGHPTADAERLLATMQGILALMRTHVVRELRKASLL